MFPHGTQDNPLGTHDIPPRYSRYPHIYHDIPHGTEHPHGTQGIPHSTQDIPHSTQDIPHSTQDIPPRYCTHIIQGDNVKFRVLVYCTFTSRNFGRTNFGKLRLDLSWCHKRSSLSNRTSVRSSFWRIRCSVYFSF